MAALMTQRIGRDTGPVTISEKRHISTMWQAKQTAMIAPRCGHGTGTSGQLRSRLRATPSSAASPNHA